MRGAEEEGNLPNFDANVLFLFFSLFFCRTLKLPPILHIKLFTYPKWLATELSSNKTWAHATVYMQFWLHVWKLKWLAFAKIVHLSVLSCTNENDWLWHHQTVTITGISLCINILSMQIRRKYKKLQVLYELTVNTIKSIQNYNHSQVHINYIYMSMCHYAWANMHNTCGFVCKAFAIPCRGTESNNLTRNRVFITNWVKCVHTIRPLPCSV